MIEDYTSWGDWFGYGPSKMHFSCNDTQLEAGYTLSDYHIQPGHVIVCKP